MNSLLGKSQRRLLECFASLKSIDILIWEMLISCSSTLWVALSRAHRSGEILTGINNCGREFSASLTAIRHLLPIYVLSHGTSLYSPVCTVQSVRVSCWTSTDDPDVVSWGRLRHLDSRSVGSAVAPSMSFFFATLWRCVSNSKGSSESLEPL